MIAGRKRQGKDGGGRKAIRLWVDVVCYDWSGFATSAACINPHSCMYSTSRCAVQQTGAPGCTSVLCLFPVVCFICLLLCVHLFVFEGDPCMPSTFAAGWTRAHGCMQVLVLWWYLCVGFERGACMCLAVSPACPPGVWLDGQEHVGA